MFQFSPKDGKSHFEIESANDRDGVKLNRKISFDGELTRPARIRLSNGNILTFSGEDSVPVWVTIMDQAEHEWPDKDKKVNSLISVAYDHVAIRLVMQTTTFDDVLCLLREGREITFNVAPPNEEWYEETSLRPNAPPTIGYDEPQTHNNMFWRDDLKRTIAVAYVTIGVPMCSKSQL